MYRSELENQVDSEFTASSQILMRQGRRTINDSDNITFCVKLERMEA